MAKILVIEDEGSIRENLLEILEIGDHECLGAENGKVGLDAARRFLPDVIVCDVTMPEMDGFEVLDQLRKDPLISATQFILLTARVDRTFMRFGMESGADDYLTKPITPAEVLAAVEARLSRQRVFRTQIEQMQEQAKRRLMSLVTHELRTPLVSINTTVEIISRQVSQLSPKELQDMLEMLASGSHRLNRVVEQIVLTMQLETGLLKWDKINEEGLDTPLSDILKAAVSLARRFAYLHPDVIVQIDERDPEVVVRANTHALRHALAELITNAISFSPEHETIQVSQWLADGQVWLSVTDQGPGFDAGKLEQVMTDFEQIDRDSQEQQGIGLGLPLVRQIIAAHGGQLTVNSVVGKGTQVTINLPVVDSIAT